MKNRQTIVIVLFCMTALCACREKYLPVLREVSNDYLVVDGYINSGPGPTTILLSRSSGIYAAPKIIRETKAVVRVEAKNAGTSVALTETSAGIYTHPQLTLNANEEYRLSIQTSNGKRYVSDYSKYRRMPDIDSIPWRQTPEGVEIGTDLHDNVLPVGYYQFKFDETWEIRSTYLSYLKKYGRLSGYLDSVGFQPDWSIYQCWNYDTSYNPIRLYSTEKLTRNQVSFYELVKIPFLDEKLGVRYSLFLKVVVLSKQHFQYMEQLKRNTELIGSVFDAQPSDNWGNMYCISTPQERVIGFMEVSEEKTKRLFITNNQLKDWNLTMACEQETHDDTALALSGRLNQGWWLTTPAAFGAGYFVKVNVAPAICVDCRLRGTTKKPSFW